MATLDFLKRMLGTPNGEVQPEAAADPRSPASTDRRAVAREEAEIGMKVLVIDDSLTIVNVLSRMLEQNQYQVLSAGDAESGLALARTEKPELIFLDVVLPGMSGFDALRHFRKQEETATTPVIMISGNAMATEQFYVKRIGADEFMKKPFGRVEVFSVIQKLVQEGRLHKRSAPQEHLLVDDGERVLPDPQDGDEMRPNFGAL
ncbi:response regulator [Lysobacter soyae]|uniref:Response regulator n=1 Tax=Lysobacter soyae TaxID=2764185 RepID=A0ABX8WPA4_9GAMM|nr:response regulator [Lysobacter sp. CJ11]QYR52646.1 response regulator [Lysobacter sp. CJ11]